MNRKRVTSIVIILLLVIVVIPFPTVRAASLLEDDFEACNLDAWIDVTDAKGQMSCSNVNPYTGTWSLRAYATSGGYDFDYIYRTWTPTEEEIKIVFYVSFIAFIGTPNLIRVSDAASKWVAIIIYSSTKFVYYSNSGTHDMVDFDPETGVYYKVEIRIRADTNRYDIYIDDVKKVDNVLWHDVTAADPSRVLFCKQEGGARTQYYVDDLDVSIVLAEEIINHGVVASDSTPDDEQWFFLNVSMEILPDASIYIFTRIDIDPMGLNLSCSYTNSTDTFVEENDPNNYMELDVAISVKIDINSTHIRVDYYIRIHQNVTKDGAYDVGVYSTASGGISDSDTFNSVFTLTIRTPAVPTYFYGAGFNASSQYVELHWSHNLLIVDFFEVQNSTDDSSWGYLGQNTTAMYTDGEVSNGTQRYYKVRACRSTGVGWKNSTFTDSDFETVYFIMTAGVGAGAGPAVGGTGWMLLQVIVGIIGVIGLAMLLSKR